MYEKTLEERLDDCRAFFELINSPSVKKEILDSIDKINRELPHKNMLFFVDSLERYIEDFDK